MAEKKYIGVIYVFIILSLVYLSPTICTGFWNNGLVGYNSYNETVWQKWLYAYRLVTELSRNNINVSKYVPLLETAYLEIGRGDYDDANRILDEVIPELDSIHDSMGSILFIRNIRRIVVVVSLALVPVLFYFFFPRLYLYVWYYLHRRWLLKR